MNKEIKMKEIVETRNLIKNFSLNGTGIEVLRGVNMKVFSGEFVTLVGPSGSGKSTLLHILGAMETPSSGEVYLNGRELSKIDEREQLYIRRNEIGFIFQAFNLLPTLNALENVEIPLQLAGVQNKERQQQASHLLECVGLGKRMRHHPNQLSGGERQRVAIARALANGPSLLLADEPTGNLDSKTGASIVELFHELNQRGQTILLVTHDEVVAKQSGRVLRISDGKILA